MSVILNSLTFLARPAESRKVWALNAGLIGFPLLGERGALEDTRRVVKGMMCQNSIDSANCSLLDSARRPAQRPPPEAEFQEIPGIQGTREIPATIDALLAPIFEQPSNRIVAVASPAYRLT
jgi:hypothetical protein